MILVVDNDAQVRKSLVRLLESHGHVVTAVDGGRQALDFLRMHAARLVFVDLNMPDVNGLAVLRAVRADTRLAALPVVILTAALDDDCTVGLIASLGGACIVKASDGWVDRLLEAADRYLR